MRSAWLGQLKSLAPTVLFSMMALAVSAPALGQAAGPKAPNTELTEPSRARDREANATPVMETTQMLPGPRGRPFMAALFVVPLVTFAGPLGPRDSEIVSPADRFALTQLVGVGYVVNPRFRFGVMGIFNEVFTGMPQGSDAWQFGGVAPVAIGTFGHFIIGGGPLIGYRSAGKHQVDAGAVVLSGASIPLRKGLSLNIVAPVSALFMNRRAVSVGVAAGLAKVF